MGLDDEFRDGVEWVKTNLDFDVDGEVSVFETSIRLVGGLLSAFHACGDPVLLAKARDLADRLLPSFDASPLGIPHRYINLRTGALRGQDTNPAETGTFIPEFGFLSRATGDDRYRAAAKRALVSMFERRSKIGLLADAIDCMTGEWKSRRATIGPPSDSYYEYLWDGWDLLGDRDCLAMYRACTAAILKHQPARARPNLWFVDVDFETGKRINWRAGRARLLLRRAARPGRERTRRRRLHAQLGGGAAALWRAAGRASTSTDLTARSASPTRSARSLPTRRSITGCSTAARNGG